MTHEDAPRPRLFVSEFLCSGAWPDAELPPSLFAEGLQMLVATIEDFLVLGWQVSTTLDARIGAFPIQHPSLEVRAIARDDGIAPVRGSVEAAAFDDLARASYAAIVIAPEFHGHLLSRVRRLEEMSETDACRLQLNCSTEAIELCSDKLRLSEFLQAAGIPTIATGLFDPQAPRLHWDYPVVIKPRDGAGSTLTFRVLNSDDLQRAVAEIGRSDLAFEFIQQPFVVGRPLAMTWLGDRCLPLTEQLQSNDGRFHYLGSRLSHDHSPQFTTACELLIEQCRTAIPGLHGYVGFDLIQPATRPDHPVLVEINPRLTSSYLAYRQSSSENLAAVWCSAFDPS